MTNKTQHNTQTDDKQNSTQHRKLKKMTNTDLPKKLS